MKYEYGKMTLEVLKNVLSEQGLTLSDLGTLLVYYDGGGKTKFFASASKLRKLKLLKAREYNLIPVDNLENIVDCWLNEEHYVKSNKERFLVLADKLRELYPEGKKAGTNYMWRDSRLVIAKKLQTLSEKFQVKFTDEEAIDATKRYVEQFNGNYQYMQLLKYFILKRDINKQEETSQLLSFMENKDAVVNYEFGELVL